jgi:uncharacterized protein YbaR (Trm112 family)
MLDDDVIALLRCPVTRQPLRLATEEEKTARGIPLDEAALVTEDGQRVYRTEMGLPILVSAKDVAATG